MQLDNGLLYLLVGIVSVLSAYGCVYLLNRQQLLDIPNERSSHSIPVPRGGGISFSLLYLAVLAGLWAQAELAPRDALVLVLGGGCLAVVGFIDDRVGLSSRFRLLIQLLCTAAAVVVLYFDGGFSVTPGLLAWLGLLVFASVWWINLFNFLDGIDGYAASEGIFICLAGAGLCLQAGSENQAQLFLLLAASMIGFVIVNWPPAKLFMGDVGSYFLGFIIASLAIITLRDQLISIGSWIVLTALFWIDASYTLIDRMVKGERWHQAHRSHAYQILSRRWNSHRRVTILAIAVNGAWLLPLAYGVQWLLDNDHTVASYILVIFSCLPILFGIHRIKSGIISD